MKTLFSNLLIIILFFGFGCNDSSNPVKPLSGENLKGIIKDIQGNLISDAKVFLIFDFDQHSASLSKTSITKPLKTNSVVLDSFVLIPLDYKIIISWITYSEINNAGFQIERKINSSNWTAIGFIAGNGTNNDTTHYSFIDQNLYAGTYCYRLKIMEFDGSFVYSNELEYIVPEFIIKSVLNQNYPNPFDSLTTISFELRKSAFLTINLCNLKDDSIVSTLIESQLGSGKYSVALLSSNNNLPSNGYKVLMKVEEDDSAYTLEKNILLTKFRYEPSIINSAPNAISKDGLFEINYLPIGLEFVQTGMISADQIGMVTVKNNLKIIVYKPGFKIAQKDIIISSNKNVEIQLEPETD